ncbi:MAG: hypothetical protein RL516_1255 [Bacteroidota bacterium]|jgi:hypothetical protein
MTPKEQKTIEILITAIKGRNLIRFEYEGQIRIVEPYLIGELYNKFQNHLEEGKFALRAWFVRGYSSNPINKLKGNNWRIYELNKMIGIEILSEKNLIVRPLYNQYDNAFKRINFHVKNK